MQLIHDGSRYELICNPQFFKEAETAGFIKDRNNRWFTIRGEVAKKFAPFATALAQQALQRHERRLMFSQAVDAEFKLAAPKGLTYLPFQRAGILFALQREITLIADVMRLGKTVQALGMINAEKDITTALVVTKAALKINWQRECLKWLTRSLESKIVPSSDESLPDVPIVITNYDNIPKQRKAIDLRRWDLLIFDESHYLQNKDSKRTKYSLGYTWRNKVQKERIKANRTVFLSGTPIMKRPVNIWPIVREADPQVLGKSYEYYTRRYCKGWDAPWGWDASGASNLDELQERLRSTFMIRRERKDVLDYLPDHRKQLLVISNEKVRSLIQSEINFLPDVASAKREADIAQKNEDSNSFVAAINKLKKYENPDFEGTSRVRHQTAVAKVPYAIDLLLDVLEEEEKVTIFAHHQDVIKGLLDGLKKFNAVAHHGHMTNLAKQQSIDRFQTDPKCRVFIGSITGAEGYSIAISSYALFVEFDWRSTMMNQAEDRLWLFDKRDSILYQYLVFDGSLDQVMAKHYVESDEALGKALSR